MVDVSGTLHVNNFTQCIVLRNHCVHRYIGNGHYETMVHVSVFTGLKVAVVEVRALPKMHGPMRLRQAHGHSWTTAPPPECGVKWPLSPTDQGLQCCTEVPRLRDIHR